MSYLGPSEHLVKIVHSVLTCFKIPFFIKKEKKKKKEIRS